MNGMLYNFTGQGKGKTSAALGIVLRALGWHWKVEILQFIKGEMMTGEKRFFAEYFPELVFRPLGLGLTCLPGDHAGFARSGWELARARLLAFDGQLLVLDELNTALDLHYLELPGVVHALRHRRSNLNVVVTGWNSPPELLEISDLVSEVTSIKHPYEHGIMAVKGLDF